MKRLLKILIVVIALLVIGFLSYGAYSGHQDETLRIRSEQEKQRQFNSGDYDIVIENDLNNFTLIAEKFSKEEVPDFCLAGDNEYRVNGNDYDLKNNTFFESHTMGGYYRTFDELLSSDHLPRENFDFYKNFLDKYSFVRCITFDPNLKANKNSLPLYAITFEVTNYDGYIYVSDGSITDNVYEKYRDNEFIKLEQIFNTNWYKFRYRNEYGI